MQQRSWKRSRSRSQQRRLFHQNAPSSKSGVVESLLALGDVARNNQLGEVKAALAKARVFIDKFNLTQFEARYQQLIEKLAKFERGEKVERDETHQSRTHQPFTREWWAEELRRRARERASARADRDRRAQQEYASHGGQSGYEYYRRKQEEREQSRRAARTFRQEQRRAHQQARAQDRAQREKEKQTKYAEAKATYTRPKTTARIEWVWKRSYSPKRGKAGSRWEAYYGAKTIEEMLAKGGRWSDVKWNVTHGLMRVNTVN